MGVVGYPHRSEGNGGGLVRASFSPDVGIWFGKTAMAFKRWFVDEGTGAEKKDSEGGREVSGLDTDEDGTGSFVFSLICCFPLKLNLHCYIPTKPLLVESYTNAHSPHNLT